MSPEDTSRGMKRVLRDDEGCKYGTAEVRK